MCAVHGPMAKCDCGYTRGIQSGLIALLALGCSSVPGVLPASDPCSLENPARLAFIADCDAKIDKCPRDDKGYAIEACPALVACEAEQKKVCG